MTKDGSLAIVCFAYKRPDHLRVCLDSLAKNLEVKELPLHIFVDGPRNEESAKLTKKVIEVSESARGFLSINLHVRKANFGLYKSLTEGITDLFEFYESLVVLEDDLEVSPYFLRYMIDGLALYKDCKEVASVHGYLPPISKECDLPDTFFLPGADCWGWATWRDRWSSFRRDPRNMAKEISSLNLTHEFNLLSNYNYFGMLEDKALKYNDSWAICWHATCYLAGQITLYPGRSLVKNIGLDLSGESCGSFEKKMMSSEFTDRAINVYKIPLFSDPKVFNIYCDYFKSFNAYPNPIVRVLKRYIKKLVFKLKEKLPIYTSSKLSLIGPYSSYLEAKEESTGYEDHCILDKVLKASSNLLEGKGIYERDGDLYQSRPSFNKIEEILSKYIRLDSIVVDFGAGLGNTYINYPEFFQSRQKYYVIEQSGFVSAGKIFAQKYTLDIHYTESLDCLNLRPHFIIFSSVLPYIQNINEVVDSALKLKPKFIIIDRTAFTQKDRLEWWIQYEETYYARPVSYPFRPFNEKSLVALFSGYQVLETWINPFDPKVPMHKGILLKASE